MKLLLTLGLLGLLPLQPCESSAPAAASWRSDAIWHDGKAEKATYAATRTIYGLARSYDAICYTNLENVERASAVKSADGKGLSVFKHHWSERIPTENYDYDFSVSSYLEADTLRPYKLTVASQEDCGASFKQIWREKSWSESSGGFRYWESVYFPGTGVREGRLESSRDLQFFDSLSCALRDFDFEARKDVELRLLSTHKSNQAGSWEPVAARVHWAARERLELPIGAREAQRLELFTDGASPLATFWMDADGSAPWLHVLLRYAGPDGQSYALKSFERSAYWERPKH